MACTNNSVLKTEIYNELLHINKRDLSPSVENQEHCENIDIKKEPGNNMASHGPHVHNRDINLLEDVSNTVSSNSCDKEAYYVVKEENLETVINTDVDLSFENNLVPVKEFDCDTKDLLEDVSNTVSNNSCDKEAYDVLKEENLETAINNDVDRSFENNLVPIKQVDCEARDLNPSYALQKFCEKFDMAQEPLADTIISVAEAVKVDDDYNNEDCSDEDNSASSYSFELVTCNMEEQLGSKLIDENDKHHFVCNACTMAFKTKSALTQHRYKHTHTKSYVCDTCSKGFYFKSHLELHKLTHTGEKPYACDICNNRFSSKKSLEYHIRIHTGEKAHVCPICNKAFNRNYDFKLHQLTHTGEKKFVCPICNKGFNRNYTFKLHQLIHSDQKTYVCNICNKAFTHKNSLYVHKKDSHTGDKSHVCDVCNKSFTRLFTLKKHKLSHTGNKQDLTDRGGSEATA